MTDRQRLYRQKWRRELAWLLWCVGWLAFCLFTTPLLAIPFAFFAGVSVSTLCFMPLKHEYDLFTEEAIRAIKGQTCDRRLANLGLDRLGSNAVERLHDCDDQHP